MNTRRIVAIGGALVDVRARTRAGWAPGRSLPGVARLDAGGAARNVAANLARLGYPVTLLTAVGDDALGTWLLDITAGAGVDVERAVRRHVGTGLHVSVAPEGGDAWSIADASLIEGLTPTDLEPWSGEISEAVVVISDANLSEETHRALAGMVRGARVLLGTSPDKAVQLRGVLSGAAVIVCNRAEALSVTGLPGTLSWQALGTALLTEGVERVVITQGVRGVAVVTSEAAALAPAVDVPVVDPTGAGDAVAAVAVHAYFTGLGPDETAELAATAAAIVVQSQDSTPAALAGVVPP